jgi:hypothetical protein
MELRKTFFLSSCRKYNYHQFYIIIFSLLNIKQFFVVHWTWNKKFWSLFWAILARLMGQESVLFESKCWSTKIYSCKSNLCILQSSILGRTGRHDFSCFEKILAFKIQFVFDSLNAALIIKTLVASYYP